MSDDLIDHYTKSGLISDPTRNFRPCDGCGRRCHPDDLMTRDVENYGGHETIELCERCDTPPEPVGIEGINFDALNLDANAERTRGAGQSNQPETPTPLDGASC